MRQQVYLKSWFIFSKVRSVTWELEWKSSIWHIMLSLRVAVYYRENASQHEDLIVSTISVLVRNCHMGCSIMAFVLSWCVPIALKQIDLTWNDVCIPLNKHAGCKNVLKYIKWTCVYGCVLLLPVSPLFATYTGCGRKNSPVWEANKFKNKENMANVFFYFWKVHRMPFYINVF